MKKNPHVSRLYELDAKMDVMRNRIYDHFTLIEDYSCGDSTKAQVRNDLLFLRRDVIKYLDYLGDSIEELENNPNLPSRIK